VTNLNHPAPVVIAQTCEQIARVLRRDGTQAKRMAAVLASRGYRRVTLGAYGRAADTTSSTERAALDPDLDWADIDAHLALQLRMTWSYLVRLEGTIAKIMAHASDDDPVPAGTGECLRCAAFCRPTAERPEFRIKAGFCPACYQTWVRQGRPDRTDYTLAYRPPLGDTG
jgi:hypothetical protein